MAFPWFVYAALVVVGATGIHFFSKLANNTMPFIYGLSITMAAALVSALVILPAAQGPLLKADVFSKNTVFYILVGVCITLAHFGIFAMFKAGAPMSVATPFVRFAPAVLAVLIGLLYFQEAIKPVQMLGVGLAALSFYLVTYK